MHIIASGEGLNLLKSSPAAIKNRLIAERRDMSHHTRVCDGVLNP